MTKLNRDGKTEHSCQTPLVVSNEPDNSPYTLTQSEVCEQYAEIKLANSSAYLSGEEY